MKAVIIDDLEDARITLRQDLIDYCPEVELVGEADGVVSGLKLIRNTKPDIVFLDISMNDGTGFDLLEIADNTDFNLIFTTASDTYAIRAFKFSAIDYLLKPIDVDELQEAVNKAKETAPSSKENYALLQDNLKKGALERIALHTQEKIQIHHITEILRCEASVNYTTFYFTNGTKCMVTKTLKVYDQMLSDSGFFRVHQSHLINLNQIKEYIKSDGGYLIMNDGSDVPISSRKKADLVRVISEM